MPVKNHRWIPGGDLMERWGLNAFELRQLVYEEDIKAYMATTGTLFIHHCGPNSWMLGWSPVREALKNAPLLPLDEQKLAMNVLWFKPEDVEKMEKEHPDVQIDRKKYDNETFVSKKLRLCQSHRIECRAIAKKIWETDSSKTIADMIHEDDINRIFKGRVYSEKTIRNRIKDLCPNRIPGRRPKKN